MGEQADARRSGQSLGVPFPREAGPKLTMDPSYTCVNCAEVHARVLLSLEEFAGSVLGQTPVADSVTEDVRRLAYWLPHYFPTVSAGVAPDGLLSLAAISKEGTHLYIEVDRNGSSEAVVSRSPTQAKAVDIALVSELTPETIIGAIEGSQ